jgi:cell volume regulation protein A
VVFFVVLISATLQGSTLAVMARKLRLTLPPPATPTATLEISALGDVDVDIIEYKLSNESRAVGRRLAQLALPDSAVVAMITRDHKIIAPRGSTLLLDQDHLFIVLKPLTRPFVDHVFSGKQDTHVANLPSTEVVVRGITKIVDIEHSYNFIIPGEAHETLEQLIKANTAGPLSLNYLTSLTNVELYIRDMVGEKIISVGIKSKTNEPRK